MRYRGHFSKQTIKDVAFVGPGDCAVASGSDDGRMFIWDRRSGALPEIESLATTGICFCTVSCL